MWSIYCLFIARINKLVDAYIRARARISKAKMNENDENVDPMRDAAPDVEHLRLEISENREVLYRIDDVPKVPTTPFFFFFCEQEREGEGEGSFLFFSKWFSSRQLGFWCSFPNKRKTINNKISLGQFIVYWQFFDLEEGPNSK
jgi:hypothetical protein